MKHTMILSVEQAAQAARKRILNGGVAVGALLTGLGVAAVFAPLLLGWSLAVILMAGFVLYGAAQLLAYLETDRQQRSLWTLLTGLALTAFAGFSLWAAFATSYGSAALIAGLGTAVALFTVVQGISQIIAFDEMRRNGVPGAGWVLAAGILNAVVGNLMAMQPVIGWVSISTVWGIYLMVSGVALAAESLSGHRGCSADA